MCTESLTLSSSALLHSPLTQNSISPSSPAQSPAPLRCVNTHRSPAAAATHTHTHQLHTNSNTVTYRHRAVNTHRSPASTATHTRKVTYRHSGKHTPIYSSITHTPKTTHNYIDKALDTDLQQQLATHTAIQTQSSKHTHSSPAADATQMTISLKGLNVSG